MEHALTHTLLSCGNFLPHFPPPPQAPPQNTVISLNFLPPPPPHSQQICAVFEGMVSQLLLCQPDDPAKSLIHHLCTTSGLQPPRSCPAPVPLKQAVPDKPEKADDKKQDTREEELKRINAEHKRKEEMKKLDEDSAADFASAF